MTATRMPLISGNWKMHLNHFEAITLVQQLGYLLKDDLTGDDVSVEVSVHPPFTDIRSVQTTVQADKIPLALGAQHCHWESKGAFTGEVAPSMLAKLDVAYVVVGHSERRELFGESDEWVNKKVKAVLAAEMTPIVCVGETLVEREEGATADKVSRQVTEGLAGLTREQVAGLVVAYEPIWAIGTGRTASADDAQTVCGDVVRAALRSGFGDEAADSVRIQYGGSVKPDNAAELLGQPDIDGALVGGASLTADDFAAIVQAA
jgi:triosephosphate isomerase